MKPFAARPLEQNDRVFSYRLSRARRCVENAFGVLANRWGYMLTALRQEPQNVETMVLACVTLHNMLRMACADDAALGDRENEQHNLISGSLRDGAVLDDLERRLYATTPAGRRKDRDCISSTTITERPGRCHGSGVWCSDGAVQCLLILTVRSPFHKLI